MIQKKSEVYPVKDTLKNMKIHFILLSILCIALGVVLLVWPDITLTVICFSFGALLLLYGLVCIISFLTRGEGGERRVEGRSVLFLFVGIVAAALGVVLLVRPVVVQTVLPVIVGLCIVVDGLLNLKRALELRRMNYPRWHISLILCLVSVALGVLVVLRPLESLDALVMLVGAVFLYTGAVDLFTLILLGRVTRQWRKKVPVDVDPIDQ